ncbi:RNA polymerase sigma-70 factor (ECF subfamily) [Mucilaginibacter gracilis]|uniref:RNA polymerase sigma-70 factor (ECF subfamily) n=1 Tax=Mucilaginibacter gracilis TaxID=423350 RepID=A0A495IXW3_9SPHI|nr:RNA polymerase sigma factor [Mucilaginibacter gracilis]RKR80709.1 RNA polymerase sigma-70 factor (ECF subfamily) [Mucilaginibacter gracilis]
MIVPLHVDEKEMLLRLQAGDRRAFDHIYRQYKDRIYGSLLKLVRVDDLAEELLQEVFFKLWLNRTNLSDVQSFSSYLYRMAANLVADFYRKAALDKKLIQRLTYTMTELYDHIEDHINFKESNVLIEQAISSLSPQRRMVYNLCKVEGKSYQEVSQILGISTSTINDHLVKAKRAIQKHFINSQEATITIILIGLMHHP